MAELFSATQRHLDSSQVPAIAGGEVANSAEAFADAYAVSLNRAHAALQGIDRASADGMAQVLTLVKDALDQGVRDRFALAQVCNVFRVRKPCSPLMPHPRNSRNPSMAVEAYPRALYMRTARVSLWWNILQR